MPPPHPPNIRMMRRHDYEERVIGYLPECIFRDHA
jgi:hypothetical protein